MVTTSFKFCSFSHVPEEDSMTMQEHISVLDHTLAFIPVLEEKVKSSFHSGQVT